MCFPDEKCYEVIAGPAPTASARAKHTASSWYSRLWQSVQRANQESPR